MSRTRERLRLWWQLVGETATTGYRIGPRQAWIMAKALVR